MRQGVSPEDLHAGVRRYAAFIRATGKEGTEYVKQAASFFGPDRHWEEPWSAPSPSVVLGARQTTGGQVGYAAEGDW